MIWGETKFKIMAKVITRSEEVEDKGQTEYGDREMGKYFSDKEQLIAQTSGIDVNFLRYCDVSAIKSWESS